MSRRVCALPVVAWDTPSSRRNRCGSGSMRSCPPRSHGGCATTSGWMPSRSANSASAARKIRRSSRGRATQARSYSRRTATLWIWSRDGGRRRRSFGSRAGIQAMRFSARFSAMRGRTSRPCSRQVNRWSRSVGALPNLTLLQTAARRCAVSLRRWRGFVHGSLLEPLQQSLALESGSVFASRHRPRIASAQRPDAGIGRWQWIA